MDVKDFFATLLESVTISHKLHLATKKYSRHKALDTFYEDAPEIVDEIIESYQGKYGIVEGGENKIDGNDPIEYLTELGKYVKKSLSLFDSEEDSEILSSIDDYSNLIDGTLYKLKELKESKKYSFRMRSLVESLNEALIKSSCDKDKVKKPIMEEDEIESEEDFREYAENKFKEVFGDELDEDRMNDTIDGLIDDNQDLVDGGEWGELIGMLNKSFGG